jgi:hypothetical protein
MAKGLFGRLIKKTAQKATKKVVKKTTPKTTTAAKQAAVRAKARKAAKTKVNIPKPSRKVGQQATLNGKAVYWGGKDWGWQSKASLTKITNGTKKTPPAKPNTTKLPVSKSENSPEVTRTRTKSAERSRKDQGYESREERLATNRALSRKPKKVTDKKGVTASEPQPTSRQYTRGSKSTPTKTTTTKTKGAKIPSKTVVSSTTKTPAKAKPTPKGRPTKKPPLNKTPAKSVSKGKTVNGTGLKGKKLGPTAKTAKATNPSSKVVGEMRDNARKWARKNVDKFETKKMAENAIKARMDTVGMTGRQRQMYKQALTKEMNAQKKRVRELSERKAMRSQKRDALNSSPSQSLQDMNQSLNNDRNQNLRRSDQIKDPKGRARKLSADMTDRKARGTLKKITHKPDNSTYKRAENKAKPPVKKPDPSKTPDSNRTGTRKFANGKKESINRSSSAAQRTRARSNSPAAQKADSERKASKGLDKVLGKKSTSTKAPARSAAAKARLRKGNDSARAHAQEMRELNRMTVNERKDYRDRMKILGNKR